MTDSRRFSGAIHVLRNVAALVCALLFFYGVPMEWDLSDDWSGQWLGLAAFLAGVGGLIWLATRRVRRYLREPRATGGRVDGLLLMLCVVVMFFAIYYYRLAVQYPGEFEGLVTRTDALYYTIVTLGTVGYGDIHAIGQTARIATMVQIVFDLVVIGSLLAIVSSGVTHRLETAARHAQVAEPEKAPPREHGTDDTRNPRPQNPTGDR
ncbi:potassium channel family protein [Nocardia amikacinitolerans]|uniref:potassium channel family protein n=1 Tax=Nocardia amikacinitolerans TaxID=756689 RepID=UPI00082DB73D|nr:potassium channel family protein [Nocardia amikacinitolerans]